MAFNFLCAFAPNFRSLFVGRFLTGTFASSPLSNAPRVLADIWGPVERGNSIALFSMMTFVGPALGPVISGFLELKDDWRWTFYVLLWLAGVGELPLIGVSIRAVIGGGVIFLRSAQVKKKRLAGHKGVPEDKLVVAMIGGIIFPITMFWFAWTGEFNSVHWIVPTIAGVFLSTSILLIFVAYLNYLTDTYLMFAASAIAINTITRSATGAAAPLFTQYMFDALGVGGGGSLIGGVAVLLAPTPFIFYKCGGPIRKRSKFAPTDSDDEELEKPREQEPGPISSSLISDDSDSTTTRSQGSLPDDKEDERKAAPRRASGAQDPDRDLERGRFEAIGGLELAREMSTGLFWKRFVGSGYVSVSAALLALYSNVLEDAKVLAEFHQAES